MTPVAWTRVRLLETKGYEIHLRQDWVAAEDLDQEGSFDLVLLALHRRDLKQAAEYSDQLTKRKPSVPILLLTDGGVYAPQGTLSRTVETGNPAELIKTVAAIVQRVSW